ncbi:hypothetical protein ACLUUI_20160 [Enterobacterales bacterium AW_CKDN230030176-1A_HGKHYDSX7]
MTEYKFDDVVAMTNRERFFEKIISSVTSWDDALDDRDEDDFDAAWSSSFKRLKDLHYHNEKDERAAKELRENVFKKVFSLTQSSEVAAHISDDVGLIADAALKSCRVSWVDELFYKYRSGAFPC